MDQGRAVPAGEQDFRFSVNDDSGRMPAVDAQRLPLDSGLGGVAVEGRGGRGRPGGCWSVAGGQRADLAGQGRVAKAVDEVRGRGAVRVELALARRLVMVRGIKDLFGFLERQLTRLKTKFDS